MYQRIITMMPPHDCYVEPFLGGGAIMRLKRPATRNLGFDLSAAAVDNFRKLLVSPEAVSQDLGPASSGLVATAEIAMADDAGPRSRIAASGDQRRRPPAAEAMRPDATPEWTIEASDGLAYLEESSPELMRFGTLVYCDPPYLMSTRSSGRLYEFEMCDADHRRLLRWAMQAECRVMISGYWSKLYADALRSWRCEKFMAMTRGGLAEECLWMNFAEPVALHDYQYLGQGFRERERIKRKKSRWVKRLTEMPLLERRALLSAISDSAFSGDARSPSPHV